MHSTSELIEATHDNPHNIYVSQNVKLNTHEEMHQIAMISGGVKLSQMFDSVREIKIDPTSNGTSVALSNKEHPMHTDGSFIETPPSGFFLYFKQSDTDGGGRSTFLNTVELLSELPAHYFNNLCQTVCRFSRQREYVASTSDYYDSTIIELLHERPKLRWRYDDQVKPFILKSPNKKQATEAIMWLADHITQKKKIMYAAKSGDLVYVPNDAYLHGRTALSSNTSTRCVWRTWLNF